MKKLFLVLIIFLVGCSAPEAVRKEAELYLPKNCVDILDSDAYQSAMVETSLVVALDNQNSYFCTWAHGGEVARARGCAFTCFTQEQVDALALAKCEIKKPDAVKSQCKIFAQGNNIVWKKQKAENLDFE